MKTNILPGTIAEVGLLCCACVHSNPEEAVTHLIEPILSSVISSLEGVPVTGFGGRGTSKSSVSIKVVLPCMVCVICFHVEPKFFFWNLNWFLSRQNPLFLLLLKHQLIINWKHYQLPSVMGVLLFSVTRISLRKLLFLLLILHLGRSCIYPVVD